VHAGGGEGLRRQREPDRGGAQFAGRQVEGPGVDDLAGAQAAALVRHDLAGHVDLAEEQADGSGVDVGADRDDGEVGDVPGVGGPVRFLGVDEGDPVGEIEVV